MKTGMQYQMELVGQTATLYVTGSLGHADAASLTAACVAAPLTARTLRLDLHGVGQLSAEGIDVVRQLLRFWRDSRHGEFRLATSYMLATVHEVAGPRSSPPAQWRPPRVNEALAGTYL